MTKQRRFELILNEYDDWMVYDSVEKRWHEINLGNYEQEMERLKRNHENLHEKYEELNEKYKKCKRELTKIKGNTSSARQIYQNLKDCFE